MGPGGVITVLVGYQRFRLSRPFNPWRLRVVSRHRSLRCQARTTVQRTAYTGGIAPWLAQPQPVFVAPMPQPLTAASV